MNQPLKSILMDKNWFLDILRRVEKDMPKRLGAYLNISNIVKPGLGPKQRLRGHLRMMRKQTGVWSRLAPLSGEEKHPGWRKLSILPTERSSKYGLDVSMRNVDLHLYLIWLEIEVTTKSQHSHSYFGRWTTNIFDVHQALWPNHGSIAARYRCPYPLLTWEKYGFD